MAAEVRKVPEYCNQCVAGPDLLQVKVEDGVATEIEPNFRAAAVHPGGGKCCVKAYGLVQKTYNPNRLRTPMKRTNPQKGRQHDPGFVPISWDEAFDIVAGKLNEIRAKGLIDEVGYPRVAASFGGGGTPTYYMGTFPAFLSAWGPVDFSFGSGQGVKCYHSEHLYGELWHRAFTVCPDTPTTQFVLSFGANSEASAGVVGAWRHAEGRMNRHLKRVQLEPHLSITGACSAEWVPLKPKTDAAFLFGMLHAILREHPREALDLRFLKDHTGSPYLIGPNGFYLRDPASQKPLLWDVRRTPIRRSRASSRSMRWSSAPTARHGITPACARRRRSPSWCGTWSRTRPSGRRRSATSGRARSAASRPSISSMRRSARRSRSTARRCRSDPSRSSSARP
jgi:phenylacetyl-CoA:acceptor oxidoreductase